MGLKVRRPNTFGYVVYVLYISHSKSMVVVFISSEHISLITYFKFWKRTNRKVSLNDLISKNPKCWFYTGDFFLFRPAIYSTEMIFWKFSLLYLLFFPQTRILITHGIRFLPHVDEIIVLVDGVVSEVGSYNNLRASKGAFSGFLDTYAKEENKSNAQEGKFLTGLLLD